MFFEQVPQSNFPEKFSSSLLVHLFNFHVCRSLVEPIGLKYMLHERVNTPYSIWTTKGMVPCLLLTHYPIVINLVKW
jgi:hypothetical protein